MKFIEIVKNHIWDSWGITGFGLIYSFLVIVSLFIFAAIKWSEWSCDNYQEVTGFESKFIAFDACYVKNKNGIFIRYDSYYKGQ